MANDEEDLIEKIYKQTGIPHEKIRKAFTEAQGNKNKAMQILENIERGFDSKSSSWTPPNAAPGKAEPICPKCGGSVFNDKSYISFAIIYCEGCGNIIGVIRWP